MVLLRRVIGDALRARRQAQHRTLREVSTAANVSLGYLSEIERGQKEASSELLASICEALGAALSEVLRDVSDSLAVNEDLPKVLVPVGGGRGESDGAGDTAGEGSGVPASSGGPSRLGAGSSSNGSSSNGASGNGASGNGASSNGASSNGSSAGASPEARVRPGVGARMRPEGKARLSTDAKVSVADGKISVAVRHEGPLKTTLRATRTSTREREPVLVA